MKAFLFAAALVSLLSCPALGADGAGQEAAAWSPLRGMARFQLRLILNTGAQEAGLEAARLRKDIESRLKIAGLPMRWLEEEPGLEAGRFPLLVFSVHMGLDKKWYRPDTYLTTASLEDLVLLEREPRLRTVGTLWSLTEHGYDNRVGRATRESLMRLADGFLEAFARANPDKLKQADVEALPEPKATEADPMEP